MEQNGRALPGYPNNFVLANVYGQNADVAHRSVRVGKKILKIPYVNGNEIAFKGKWELSKEKLENSSSKLNTDFEQILEQGKFCDISIVIKSEAKLSSTKAAKISDNANKKREFRAHKAILAGRSTVFAAMFEHDLMEKRENRIIIEDMTSELCEEMLRYIYTGKVANLDDNAEELLVIADKYALDMLKEMCEEPLCWSLDNDSVLRRLTLANMHNAAQLKAKCVEYFNKNAKKIVETEDYKKMIETQPRLIGMLLKDFVHKH